MKTPSLPADDKTVLGKARRGMRFSEYFLTPYDIVYTQFIVHFFLASHLSPQSSLNTLTGKEEEEAMSLKGVRQTYNEARERVAFDVRGCGGHLI